MKVSPAIAQGVRVSPYNTPVRFSRVESPPISQIKNPLPKVVLSSGEAEYTQRSVVASEKRPGEIAQSNSAQQSTAPVQQLGLLVDHVV